VAAFHPRSGRKRIGFKPAIRSVAAAVLGDAFSQFTIPLAVLRTSDDPEVVHQVRVGWRRFRSALWLFKPVLADRDWPYELTALSSLLKLLGELRDLDVAWHDTLPSLQETYTAGDARRKKAWLSMTQAVRQAAARRRKSVRKVQRNPEVAAALLATTTWLGTLADGHTDRGVNIEKHVKVLLCRWSERRTALLQRKLKIALKDIGNPDRQHRLRILAKRMRYSVEALHTLLPQRRAKRWRQQSTDLQMKLGTARDLKQASVLVTELEKSPEISAFLRGLATGLASAETMQLEKGKRLCLFDYGIKSVG